MSSLLIYNNNVAYSLPQQFESLLMGETYSFQIGKQELMSDSFSVDKKINNILSNEVESTPYDVIFLPYSLSEENYLELIGLRFAYHIRLTPKFNNVQTPIVFYGFEDAITLNKLSELGLILFTKCVYQTPKITVEDFKKQIEFIKKQQTHLSLSDEYFLKSFLSKIRITASGNYGHHHSIINEWSIYRWAKALSLEDEVLRKIDNNIGCDLYFKFLKLKNVVIDGEEFKFKSLKKKGAILYIDDQLDKGWDNIFKFICRGQTYNSFGIEFKNWDTQKIFAQTIAKIKDHKPDVVILDFRLHDDDFETTNITDVTGYKILEEIKKYINPGIQVIIFSATNKIWNLQALQDAGADGFILKESPENSSDEKFTNNSIENIYKVIDGCLEMSFLKDFYNQFMPLKLELISKKNFKKHPNFLPKEFVDEVIKWIELTNHNLCLNKNTFGITSSFLFYFSIIENISNRLIDVDNPIPVDVIDGQRKYNFRFRISEQLLRNFIEEPVNSGVYRKTKGKLKSSRNIQWLIKILNAFDFISDYEIDEILISNLIKKRNQIIHANATTGKEIRIELSEIITLYSYIIEGLKNIK